MTSCCYVCDYSASIVCVKVFVGFECSTALINMNCQGFKKEFDCLFENWYLIDIAVH